MLYLLLLLIVVVEKAEESSPISRKSKAVRPGAAEKTPLL